ncbi:MAG: anaerobic ribonucleoside-triphosphate reductase activating protein [Clostridia bacterium]|nr:anaerobic ribonucleoside-triphosphate reductase activating protein [Clostridia bacterium]
MNYATIKKRDVANGVGVRVSLFVSGCTHRCRGCFNAEAWDFSYGEPFTEDTEQEILCALAPDYVKGFSLLGGEPFEPANREVLASLLEKIKATYPQKTVWCYSGYDFEKDLLAERIGDGSTVRRMLACIDVLVDGKFVEEKKDLNLRFRGSSNQRILRVPDSLREGRAVLAVEYYEKKRGNES